MTCVSPQLELATGHLQLVQEACGALGLSCILDSSPPADTANPGYVVYKKGGGKFQLQLGTEFRLTVLDNREKSYEEQLETVIKKVREGLQGESPVIIL